MPDNSEDISTPDGDAEDPPNTPLGPDEEGLETPPGSAPNPYDSDKHKPEGTEKFVDEVVRSEYT